MKILNLYSGLGGNRKLWEDVDVTAVEIDEETAKVYQDYFPEDEVIVDDAHEYLLDNYMRFDFIWSSPPCPTHSRARFWSSRGGHQNKPVYPDMKLWQEIIFLSNYCESKFCVENVTPYYDDLIAGQQVGRHMFWCNFKLGMPTIKSDFPKDKLSKLEEMYGFEVSGPKRRKWLRNCVHPEIGKYILERAKGIYRKSNEKQMSLL